MRTTILAATAVLAMVAVLAGGATARSASRQQRTSIESHPNSASRPAVAGTRAGTIAFIILTPGPSFGGQLAVVRPDGSGRRSVTPPSARVESYRWSPDARWIAYVDANNGSLWLIRPDGTGLKQLIPGSSLASDDLTWSPDGKEIAVISSGPYTNGGITGCSGMRVYIFSVHGLYARKLRRARAHCSGLAWSPRGNEIAYVGSGTYGGTRISVVHADGSGRRPASRKGYGWVNWSADGKQIAFAAAVQVSHGPEPGNYRGIGVVDADGRHFHLVTRNAYNEYPAVWSPQGHRLLYGRANSGGIYVIGANGRNDHRVTSDSPPQAGWGALAWSPDGHSIVYATDRSGTDNLYLIGADGRGKVQLTKNAVLPIIDPTWVAR